MQYVLHALMALYVFQRDRNYILRERKLRIVDLNGNRTMKDRCWKGGLHWKIKTKEGWP